MGLWGGVWLRHGTTWIPAPWIALRSAVWGIPTRSRLVPCGPGRGPVLTLPPEGPTLLASASVSCAVGPGAPCGWAVLCRHVREAEGAAWSRLRAAAHAQFRGVPPPALRSGGGSTCSSASRPPEAASPTAEDKRLCGGGRCPGDSPASGATPREGPWGTAPCRVHPFV